MNEVYFSALQGEKIQIENQSFLQWNEIINEQVCSPEKLLNQLNDKQKKWDRVGTGWNAYSQFIVEGLTNNTGIELPSAQFMLSLALPKFLQKEWISAVEIEPIYLRNEVTWKKLPNRT